jgi:hypothetical protein
LPKNLKNIVCFKLGSKGLYLSLVEPGVLNALLYWLLPPIGGVMPSCGRVGPCLQDAVAEHRKQEKEKRYIEST